MKQIKYFIIYIALIALTGCGSNKPVTEQEDLHDHASHGEGASVTVWTDEFEVFTEFQPDDHHITSLVHITRMTDFKPLQDATVSLSVQTHDGDIVTEPAELAEPGIYIAYLHEEDHVDMDASIIINDGNEQIVQLGEIHLHDDDEEHDGSDHEINDHDQEDGTLHSDDTDSDHDVDAEMGASEIHFTKEQQWAAEFTTATAAIKSVNSTIKAIGTVVPHQHGLSDIVAPVEGFLNINHNQDMIVPGASVKKGDVLATLCPPIGRSNTWTERYTSYQIAEKNYERAQNLRERNAISDAEYERIEQTFLVEKSGFETLLEAYNINPGLQTTGCMHFNIKAPIDGVVSELNIRPGQNVSVGEKLMTIVDPEKVWIRADLYEHDFNRLGTPNGATLYSTDKTLHLQSNELELVSKGITVNTENRTVPVIFKVDNENHDLMIGQILQIDLYTESQSSAIMVPVQSVLDQDIQKFVFVQHSGESFEKRLVKTGPRFQNLIAISQGLNPGERIVAEGTYLLNLATVSTAVGHAHSH